MRPPYGAPALHPMRFQVAKKPEAPGMVFKSSGAASRVRGGITKVVSAKASTRLLPSRPKESVQMMDPA